MASAQAFGMQGMLITVRKRVSQSRVGKDYDWLNPVVSICFLDWRLFPQTAKYHVRFRLQEPETGLVYSEHLALHLFQMPNFRKGPEGLTDSLNKWLFFFNNGEGLNPEDLPESMRIPEVEKAMRVLKTLTEEERAWNYYFDREKVQRDAADWKYWIARIKAEAEQSKAEIECAKAEVERVRIRAEETKLEGLIGQVRLCEDLLSLPPTPDEQLHAIHLHDLR